MLSFFENPLPCALGHRTLCSTTRKYNCTLPFVPSGCPSSLSLQLELPHSRAGVALRRVRCRNFRCDVVRRNLVERPERLMCLGLCDCVLRVSWVSLWGSVDLVVREPLHALNGHICLPGVAWGLSVYAWHILSSLPRLSPHLFPLLRICLLSTLGSVSFCFSCLLLFLVSLLLGCSSLPVLTSSYRLVVFIGLAHRLQRL